MGFVMSMKTAKTISLNDHCGSKQAIPKITNKEPSVEAFVAACIRVKVSGIRNRPIPLIKNSKTPSKASIYPRKTNITAPYLRILQILPCLQIRLIQRQMQHQDTNSFENKRREQQAKR